MRSITHQSRAHLPACGWLALTLAAVTIAGCGGSGHKSTTTAVAEQQAGGHATATAQPHSATTTHDRRAAATGGAGKVALSSARLGGAPGAGKVASSSARLGGAPGAGKVAPAGARLGGVASSSALLGGAHSAGKVASAGVALRRASSKAGTGHHPSASAHPSAPEIPAGPVLKTLSGTGDAALGLLSEKTAVVLQWNTASPAIEIFTAQGFRLVASPASSGRVRLTPGEYRGLRVATKGPWTIQLRAVA